MNLNIIKCVNGWLVTKNNYDNNGINVYPSSNQPPMQEQFIFLNMDDMLEWIKTNFVLERLTK